MLKVPRDDMIRVLKATREVERRMRNRPPRRARWQGRNSPDTTAYRCKCLLKGALSNSDGTITVDNIEPIDGGVSPVESPSDTLTVSNDGGFAGPDNQPAWIEWDATASSGDGGWRLYNVKMATQSPYTGWQYNATSQDIEKKTFTLAGHWQGSESGWTKVDDTDACAGA